MILFSAVSSIFDRVSSFGKRIMPGVGIGMLAPQAFGDDVKPASKPVPLSEKAPMVHEMTAAELEANRIGPGITISHSKNSPGRIISPQALAQPEADASRVTWSHTKKHGGGADALAQADDPSFSSYAGQLDDQIKKGDGDEPVLRPDNYSPDRYAEVVEMIQDRLTNLLPNSGGAENPNHEWSKQELLDLVYLMKAMLPHHYPDSFQNDFGKVLGHLETKILDSTSPVTEASEGEESLQIQTMQLLDEFTGAIEAAKVLAPQTSSSRLKARFMPSALAGHVSRLAREAETLMQDYVAGEASEEARQDLHGALAEIINDFMALSDHNIVNDEARIDYNQETRELLTATRDLLQNKDPSRTEELMQRVTQLDEQFMEAVNKRGKIHVVAEDPSWVLAEILVIVGLVLASSYLTRYAGQLGRELMEERAVRDLTQSNFEKEQFARLLPVIQKLNREGDVDITDTEALMQLEVVKDALRPSIAFEDIDPEQMKTEAREALAAYFGNPSNLNSARTLTQALNAFWGSGRTQGSVGFQKSTLDNETPEVDQHKDGPSDELKTAASNALEAFLADTNDEALAEDLVIALNAIAKYAPGEKIAEFNSATVTAWQQTSEASPEDEVGKGGQPRNGDIDI